MAGNILVLPLLDAFSTSNMSFSLFALLAFFFMLSEILRTRITIKKLYKTKATAAII